MSNDEGDSDDGDDDGDHTPAGGVCQPALGRQVHLDRPSVVPPRPALHEAPSFARLPSSPAAFREQFSRPAG